MNTKNQRFEDIEIPVGLEARLSAEIDTWEKEERELRFTRRMRTVWWGMAASVVIALGSYAIYNTPQSDYIMTDTFSDPQISIKYVENAIAQFGNALNSSISHLELVNEQGAQAERILYNQLNCIE